MTCFAGRSHLLRVASMVGAPAFSAYRRSNTVYISRDVPPPLFRDDFATWAQLAVRYADRVSDMPIVRLDRHGLTVSVDAADAPAIGLPRRALIVTDSTSLCELRLVARSATPEQSHAMTVTLQPSRADDHALLWHALRAYQIHLGTAPSHDGSEWLNRLASTATACSQPSHAGAQGETSFVKTAGDGPATWLNAALADSRGWVSCDAAFTLASHEEAWLFSQWLEYHFAEVRAWARMSDASADLREMFTRVAEHEVEVRFVFQSGERIVRASAEMACRCIATEAARGLGMTAEHWLAGSAIASASPGKWRRAVVSWQADGYTVSSKQ